MVVLITGVAAVVHLVARLPLGDAAAIVTPVAGAGVTLSPDCESE